MIPVVVVLFTIYIAIKDLHTRTISNGSNVALFLILLLDPHLADLVQVVIAWLSLLILTLATHLGGGDFKLITVLLISQGKVVLTTNYGLGFSAFATVTLLVFILKRRSLHGSVPMGPAILAPFIVGYLAI